MGDSLLFNGLDVEIEDSKCQEEGKDAEANEKVALDGALTSLVSNTTLVTADVVFLVVFLIGHNEYIWFTVYCLPFRVYRLPFSL